MRKYYPMNLQLFAEPTGETVAEPTTPDGADNQPGGDGGQEQPTAQPVVLTQAQLDALIDKAFARGAAKAEKKSAPPEQMEQNPNAGTDHRTTEPPATDVLQKAHQMLQNAALTLAATQAGFADPTDALALAERAQLAIGDDGVVTGAQEAVEALAKAKPHLLGAKHSPPAGGAAGTGSNGSKPATSIGKAAAERARARHQSAAKAAEQWTNN